MSVKPILFNLSLKVLIINGSGDATYKHELKWDEYGRTWQAYEIGAFTDFSAEEGA